MSEHTYQLCKAGFCAKNIKNLKKKKSKQNFELHIPGLCTNKQKFSTIIFVIRSVWIVAKSDY
jgi:hypothetical protein